MGGEPRNNNHGGNGAAREDLVRELKHLREVVRDVGESFILRREGEIETILSHLAAVPVGTLRGEAPNWLREIHSLKVKQAKGRLKDLKEIDGLIEELAEQVVSAQDRRKGKGRGKRG
ncbi:hypothetical protein [Geotalea uraniireducens]|uniref:Uncharacterized protein n=1 Tax=Geotalea uraniireducens (strain Rf4) TaxID=351605 RepID=A5G4U9_GEOUR|nr:hypothetical protein [Geotalea uraniireducens]ABQ26817.1 hypothetical protein Gura_2641 [Geotalea uraniireducens Rf4]